jgi:hypothetical protein
VADTSVGAVGADSIEVVTEGDAIDVLDAPLVFVATTVNVYAVSIVNPDMSIGEDDPVATLSPGELVTV